MQRNDDCGGFFVFSVVVWVPLSVFVLLVVVVLGFVYWCFFKHVIYVSVAL